MCDFLQILESSTNMCTSQLSNMEAAAKDIDSGLKRQEVKCEQLLIHLSFSLYLQVTVIPTFESVSMQEWYQQTLERQKELGITVLGSNSTVAMQDETFPACKIEF